MPLPDRTDPTRTFPLSFAQQRLWFLAQLEARVSAAYHICAAVRLRGALDARALARSLDQIVERHEALRTRIVMVNGSPAQVVDAPGATMSLRRHDLRGNPARDEELSRLMAEESSAPFDLALGPLVRARLIGLDEQEHALLVTMHHIVSDGWSIGVLIDELSALYAAFLEGRPDPLPQLVIQYVDYAVWQRRAFAGEALEAQLAYWKTQLAGAPAMLALPTDRRRPLTQDYAGGALDFTLDAKLSASVTAFSQRHGATVFMTLLAAWAALLSRLSGQRDVVIGTPVANRQRPELEPLIGFFVNTIALRVDLSGAPTAAELLARVRQTTIDAQVNQDVPFEQVVELVQPERSLAHSPVFQTLFSFQNTPEGRLELPGLELQPFAVTQTTATYELALDVQSGSPFECTIHYASALFDRTTIERFERYWRALLEAMVADETQRVERIQLLGKAERQQVLYDWNDTALEFPRDLGVHQLFERQAARTPDAIAVVDGARRISYDQLNTEASQLAGHLLELGVAPGEFVCVALPRSLALVTAELAVLKCGAVYVPLDPDSPRERVAWTIADCGSRFVLCSATLEQGFENVSRIDVASRGSLQNSSLIREAPTRGADAAYVMYTSGSTGTPKGVVVEHRSITNLVFDPRYAQFDATDRFAFASNPAFDSSTLEVWAPLLCGACLVVIPQATLLDAPTLVGLLNREQVSVMMVIAGLLRTYAEPIAHEFPKLRYLLTGGDVVDVHATRLILQGNPPDHFVITYGPTEATQFATAMDIVDIPAAANSLPIGRPIQNTRVYVLDRCGQPVPIGVAGEIHLGGVGVARGYLNRPQLTSERFLLDPFAPHGDARMYKTGDLGRWLPNGTLEFLGREDSQVKVRGFRVELGEIEAHLLEHPALAHVAVVAREDEARQKRLVAYYTRREVVGQGGDAVGDENSLAAALRDHLSARLPEYMVPAAYVRLLVLPLTDNGKLDHKALPEPGRQDFEARSYAAPATAAEISLAAIWAELLHVERVGSNDHFFELGGHSLLAVTLIERMRRVGLHAEVRTLFAHPTLSALAQAAAGDSRAQVTVPASRIAPGCDRLTPDQLPLVSLSQAQIDAIVARVPGGAANVQDIYPLAPLQEGILFHHALGQGRDPYLMSVVMGCRERATVDNILDALSFVIGRHDVLRTAFVSGAEHEALQVVWRKAPLPTPQEVQLDPANPDPPAALRQAVEQACSRLDLTRPPLMRVYVARAAERGEWLMLLRTHHIATDHTTMQELIREVQLHLRGATGSLAPAPAFREHVHHARAMTSPEEHEAFFRELLGDVDAPTIPFGLSDVRGDGAQVRQGSLRLGPGFSARVREASRRAGVLPATLFHVAFARVLAATSFRDDIVFGTVLLGRMRSSGDADRAMGMLINTLPVRARIDQTPVIVAAREMNELLSKLFHHEHASLVLAKRCSAVPAESPLFSALLNCRQAAPNTEDELGDEGPEENGIRWYQGAEQISYPLVFSVDDEDDEFELSANVVPPLIPDDLCQLMREAVAQLVEALDRAPDTPLRALGVLPAAERKRLLAWMQGPRGTDRGHAVVELFDRWVRKTPDATAVVQGSRSVSYAELDARSNALAQRLLEAGVKPGEHVAIALPRSIELVAAVVAVLQAGAVYVPLDPTHPPERLAWTLADCAAAALIAEPDTVWPSLTAPLVSPRVTSSNADRVRVARGSDDCALVIYTSGSTGTPKGVRLPHRGIERLAMNNGYLEFTTRDRVAFASNPAFDASTLEVWGALLNGGCCVVLEAEALLEPQQLSEALRERQVTILLLTTALFNQCAAVMPEAFASLRWLLTGGERNSPAAFAAICNSKAPPRLLHCYGPAEATTLATSHEVRAVPEGTLNIPLGRPLADTRVCILDTLGQLTPRGAMGELYIGGAGLALGYLNRPELSAERFLPDPFSDQPGARFYKTGDLGRWRNDGTIEFLGRDDFQVKLRGFRIELGEIESRLALLPGVAEAVVLAREDEPGLKRLVAYVTLDSARTDATTPGIAHDLSRDRLSEWSEVFDKIYQTAGAAADAAFDHVGWNSTYTGKPLPAEQMRDWLDNTVTRLRELRPSRVLEIGCGTGMLLHALAPRCERYVGCDISAGSLQRLSSKLEGQPWRDRITLVRADAADFSELPRAEFDTVVLNSVVQYFPSLDYLNTVIEAAVASLGPAGYIFIGDVRHHGLARAFHFSVQLHHATPDMDPAELADRVQNKLSSEAELLVDPDWFKAIADRLPRIGQVLVRPKLDRGQNELSAYRYDVVLAVGDTRLPVPTPARWVDAASLAEGQLETLVREAESAPLGLRGISNRRVAREAAAVDLLDASTFENVGQLWEKAAELAAGGSTAGDLAALCERHQRALHTSWLPSAWDGAFHAIISPTRTSGSIQTSYDFRELGGAALSRPAGARREPGFDLQSKRDHSAFFAEGQGPSNDPLRARRHAALREWLRSRMTEQLPEYMVPSSFVVLDTMPLTPNGKIDRRALPAPGEGAFVTRAYAPPRGDLEGRLATVWAELLRVSRVGRDDNFFELGGHSLLAITLIERMRERGLLASVQDIFVQPTLAGFAAASQLMSAAQDATELVEGEV